MVVPDGLGGEAAGEIASRQAIYTLLRLVTIARSAGRTRVYVRFRPAVRVYPVRLALGVISHVPYPSAANSRAAFSESTI